MEGKTEQASTTAVRNYTPVQGPGIASIGRKAINQPDMCSMGYQEGYIRPPTTEAPWTTVQSSKTYPGIATTITLSQALVTHSTWGYSLYSHAVICAPLPVTGKILESTITRLPVSLILLSTHPLV
ncbi:hypothetical protein HZ326_14321 [Fusarium oxysporum f. sp. albedinis]|nr:hypothetical protein HZ326_14321 [Fusarium oxysporum f. sp. albedinis]